MNKESSTTNMELPIACMSACVPRAVIWFLTAKNTSVVEIHRQLTVVYGSDVMSQQMVRKLCREFLEGRHKVHESHTGCLKVVTNESINTICALLNKDHRLTLQELETIMNDDLGDSLSRMSISHIVTNLGTQFYQSSVQKLVLRYDEYSNLFDDYVEK